jgi:4-azaleucine resistance transporter AzlC
MEQTIPSPKQVIQTAWSQSFPIVLGYLSVGFAFGILAQKAGISTVNTLLMSIIVYAGSAQLIAVSLFAAGTSPWLIIFTTFVVNLRHMLFSAALSPYLKNWRRALIPIFTFELTDETFGVHSTRFSRVGAVPQEAITINVISQLSWVGGTFLGITAGNLIQDITPFGLDFALSAMFIALLVLQVQGHEEKTWIYITVALVAGVLSTALVMTGLNQWSAILATLFTATLGVVLETWTKTRSS